MSTELAQYSPQQLSIIKEQIAVGASDGELALFCEVARRTGLDPFSRQIYAVQRWDRRTGRERMVIQTGIDGFRAVAQRSNEFGGQLGPYWCGPDGKWADVWLSPEPPSAAKVGVIRKGWSEPCWRVARYDAFCQVTKDGKPSGLWAKMPDIMLAKCAEAQAIRAAFPNDLSGLYTTEEMAQADVEAKGDAGQAKKEQEAIAKRKIAELSAAVGNAPLPSSTYILSKDEADRRSAGEVAFIDNGTPFASAPPEPPEAKEIGSFPDYQPHTERKPAPRIPKHSRSKNFADAKKALGEKSYYGILGAHGFEKSNQIPDDATAEIVLAAMRDVLADRKAKAKLQAQQEQDAAGGSYLHTILSMAEANTIYAKAHAKKKSYADVDKAAKRYHEQGKAAAWIAAQLIAELEASA